MLSISIDLVSPHWLIGDGMAWQSYTFSYSDLAAAATDRPVRRAEQSGLAIPNRRGLSRGSETVPGDPHSLQNQGLKNAAGQAAGSP